MTNPPSRPTRASATPPRAALSATILPAAPPETPTERSYLEHVWPGLALLVALIPWLGTRVLGVGVLAAALAIAASQVLAHRDPRCPPEPRRQTARMPSVRREPPRQIPLLSRSCVICGRPLSNPHSMRARVGSTCIRTYGARPAWQANPDHDRWNAEWGRARAEQAQEQSRLNLAYEEERRTWPARRQAWLEELDSPAGVDRRLRRQRAKQQLAGRAGWTAAALILLLLI